MRLFHILVIVLFLTSCLENEKTLPVYGPREVLNKTVNGEEASDIVYHEIASFSFINQDSVKVTNETFDNKIYVADFFFTSCPSICPAMAAQMLRVYEKFKSNPKVEIISHTVDPEYDTIPALKAYAEKLDVTSDKWHFVTGEKEDIYNIAQKSYLVTSKEDPLAPGGFLHSGAFILVDPAKRIRGIYDGTEREEVDQLMRDIEILLHEENN